MIAFRLSGCYYGDMRWRDLFPLAANLLPLDKVFVRPRDRVKSLQKLKATLEEYETTNDLAEASPGYPEPLLFFLKPCHSGIEPRIGP